MIDFAVYWHPWLDYPDTTCLGNLSTSFSVETIVNRYFAMTRTTGCFWKNWYPLVKSTIALSTPMY